LCPVGDVASAVENALAAYSDTTVAPHEYFDQTGYAFATAHRPPNVGMAERLAVVGPGPCDEPAPSGAAGALRLGKGLRFSEDELKEWIRQLSEQA
jgi:hypothetical protein